MRQDLIKTKIKEIEESVNSVKDGMPKRFEEFTNLDLEKDGIYKRIEFAIENVFDICAIINSDLELGVPERDEDIVNNLIKADILSKEWEEKLSKMKGFRNILVHRYGKIDDQIAFNTLKQNLKDFQKFTKEINNYIENEKQ